MIGKKISVRSTLFEIVTRGILNINVEFSPEFVGELYRLILTLVSYDLATMREEAEIIEIDVVDNVDPYIKSFLYSFAPNSYEPT